MSYRSTSRWGAVLSGVSGSPVAAVGEEQPRGPGDPALAAGERFTPWHAMAVLETSNGLAQIAVAAGPRGMLLFPPDFQAGTRARAVDVGGNCVDVMAMGSTVIALTGAPADPFPREETDPSKLLLFRWADDALTQVADLPIPGKACSHIVD